MFEFDNGGAGKRTMENYSTDELAGIGKKKLIPNLQEPVTYRVLDMNKSHGSRAKYRTIPPFQDTNVIGQEITYLKPKLDYRRHNPHPNKVAFLRCNVKTMLDRVCDVQTSATQLTQNRWWQSDVTTEGVWRPPRTIDTTSREHYQYQGRWIRGKTRHGCTQYTEPVVGTVPVTSLVSPTKPRLWKEGFSFNHSFDCRKDPPYPDRARRQGHFVWGELQPAEMARLAGKRTDAAPAAYSAGPPFRYLSTDSPTPPPETGPPMPYREPAASLTELCPALEPPVSRSVSLKEFFCTPAARETPQHQQTISETQRVSSPRSPARTATSKCPSAELSPVDF